MVGLTLEQVVYIARKLKWTREDIGKLNPKQAAELYNELCYQESIEDYRVQLNTAEILAAIYNTIPRKSGKVYQARDFITGVEPHKAGEHPKSEIDKLAIDAGIQLPKEES